MARTTTAAALKTAAPAPMNAKDALAELTGAVTSYEAALAEIGQELVDVETDATDEIREYLEREEANLKAELSALRADSLAKDSKIKEIQSKFSFVLGTVTERTASVVDDRELGRALNPETSRTR